MLLGKVLKNHFLFETFREVGFDYILNPETGELHSVKSDLVDSHNLHVADLENFIGLTNVGVLEIHLLADGTEVPVYDIITGGLLGTYTLNKCKHCLGDN